jgi:hypothetical protein
MGSWKTTIAAGLLGATALFAAGATPAESAGDLVVKRFLLGRISPEGTDEFIATGGRGTTNAFRDNVIMFVFTEPVDFDSINSRSVKIGIPSGQNLFIDAPGTFYRYVEKVYDPSLNAYVPKRSYRNRILFDPTSRNEPVTSQNPYGLEGTSLYSVTVPGIDSGTTRVVYSAKGRPNLRTFTTTFRTSGDYLQDYKQPFIDRVEGSDAPGVPLDNRSSVDSRADIIVYFSEQMLPSTFDPNSSFRVYNASIGKYVTGSIRAAPDGMSFTYRPAFGYGRGPSSIQVTLTTSLTDRSRNPLNKGLQVDFQSEFDPNAPNYQEIVEDVVNSTYEDATFALAAVENGRALWNKTALLGGIPGSIYAVFGTGVREINYNGTSWGSPPWYSLLSHTQMLYTKGAMGGTARTITGFQWHLSTTQGLTIGTYTGVTVKMGHNTSGALNTNFTGSFSDTQVTTFNASNYSISASMNVNGWVLGPTYTSNWSYNGNDNVVLDVNTPNNNGPYNRCLQGPSGIGGIDYHFTSGGGNLSFSGNGLDMRFMYLVDTCEAQSRWYNTGVSNPSYLDPIVVAQSPAGTVINFTYQGAKPDPANASQADLNSASAWTTDPLNDLPSYQFIRFHIEMKSNLSSQTRPQVDMVTIPFVYF